MNKLLHHCDNPPYHNKLSLPKSIQCGIHPLLTTLYLDSYHGCSGPNTSPGNQAHFSSVTVLKVRVLYPTFYLHAFIILLVDVFSSFHSSSSKLCRLALFHVGKISRFSHSRTSQQWYCIIMSFIYLQQWPLFPNDPFSN